MRLPNQPMWFHPFKKVALFLILISFSVSFLLFGSSYTVYGSSIGLESLPWPFVSSSGLLNCSVVVASSVGHGPCGGAHTMDVMGAIMIGSKLGLKANGSMLDATMDDYASTYNFTDAKVHLRDTSSNLVVVGGPGVNQITWYYNNLRNATGNRVLPVYFAEDQNGVDYIYVTPSGHSYRIEYDGLGRVSADYGLVLILKDGNRFVLLIAGLGGSGTWASCKVVASFETWNLFGNATIVKYYDSDSNGLLDTFSIVEHVSGMQISYNGVGSLFLVLFSAFPLLKGKIAKLRTIRIRRLSKVYWLLFLAAASQVILTAVSSSPISEVYTLKDFSNPFVSSDGSLNCSIVVASSTGHGPCGSAHTMDVMGAIVVGAQIGLDAIGGAPSSALDDCISSYDSLHAQVNIPHLGYNLIVVGGPGVNQITWYYNDLRNATGNRVLPAYFAKDQNGVDYIYVASSGHSYEIEHDGLGRVSADYGVVTSFYDMEHGFWVLIIAGLGGSGTLAASRLLANYKNWSMFGCAAVVRFADSNSDGYLDTSSIVESVGVGKSIEVYWDAKCLNAVNAIDWGTLSPGETKNLVMYVRNEGENGTVLTLNVYGWNPVLASDYLTVNWNYSGTPVEPGQVVAIALVLIVDSKINGITGFSVTIDVDST